MYDNNNVFAKIIRGDIPAKKIYEDEHMIIVEDISPSAPVHLLAMPKGEYVSIVDFANKASSEVVSHFFKIITKIAKDLDIEKKGYRLLANHGNDANQTVPHFHMHILAGRHLGGLLPK